MIKSFTFSTLLTLIVNRIDCYPEGGDKIQDQCEARGCCFDSHLHLSDDVPWCFYPLDYPTYKVDNLTVSFV